MNNKQKVLLICLSPGCINRLVSLCRARDTCKSGRESLMITIHLTTLDSCQRLDVNLSISKLYRGDVFQRTLYLTIMKFIACQGLLASVFVRLRAFACLCMCVYSRICVRQCVCPTELFLHLVFICIHPRFSLFFSFCLSL